MYSIIVIAPVLSPKHSKNIQTSALTSWYILYSVNKILWWCFIIWHGAIAIFHSKGSSSNGILI